MTTLETLGHFLATPGIGAKSEHVLRRHVIDIVSTWIAGAAIPEGAAIAALDLGTSALDALAKNVAFARASEIDDIHLSSLTTPGAAIVPSALTIAAQENVGAEDLTDAVAAGYEALIRLGTAISGPTVLFRGIWSTYFAAPFGVAATTSRLLKLTASQTAHALALSINLASPNAGHQHGAHTSRWLAFGLMARAGATAAFAARAGFIADLDVLESPFLANAYQLKPDLTALTDDLGARLAAEDLSFKPWCAARQTMAAAQAMRELIAAGVSPDDIQHVEAAIPPLHVKMVDHGVHASDRTSHLTSLPYQLAIAAIRPNAAMDVRQAPQSLEDDVAAFMRKVSVRGDEGLSTAYPKAWHARVTVKTRAGTREKLVTEIGRAHV